MTLATENGTFEAHQLILAASSRYFRKIFVDHGPCDHPIVHFKEVPAAHMEPLIEFMYKGETSVKRAELNQVLKSARILEIESLESYEANPEDNGYKTDSRPESSLSAESSNSGKRKTGGGRKSSHPRRLKPSIDQAEAEERRSPMFGMMGASLPHTSHKPALSPEKEKHPSTSQEHVIPLAQPSCSYDDIAASDEESELVIEEQQPMDFSAARPVFNYKPPMPPLTPATAAAKSLEALQMATPVRGTWEQQIAKLTMAAANAKREEDEKKKKKDQSVTIASAMNLEYATKLQNSLFNALSNNMNVEKKDQSVPMAPAMNPDYVAQLQNSLNAHSSMAAASNNIIEEKKDQSVPMAPAINNEFAAQLQNALSAQFMASLSSPAWLNSLSRQQGAGLGVTPPNTPQEPERRQRTAPHGGIKTGEIGANGKPSVQCPDCHKVLADPSSLYRHRKIHTGEKPHVCPFCPK